MERMAGTDSRQLMTKQRHKHSFEWTNGFNTEHMQYEAVCKCGKTIYEVWVKSHYEDDQGNNLPDSIEETIG